MTDNDRLGAYVLYRHHLSSKLGGARKAPFRIAFARKSDSPPSVEQEYGQCEWVCPHWNTHRLASFRH